MSGHSRWLLGAVACILLAGIFTPIVVLGQASAGSQEQNQLAAFVGAAESSRSYAYGAVDYAAANGLSVGSARGQLSQGDSLLAAAQTDAQAGTNIASGIQAARGAMADYAGAAASASVSLSGAGLAASVDYYAALSAVAEVNATMDVVASVAAQACGSAGAGGSGAQGFAQACAQVDANVASARANLTQAASILARSTGHVAASADISQALSLAAEARADVQACQSLLLTIASYGYSQRGQAYVSAVVEPLYASANATISAEQSALTGLTAYKESFDAYAQSQASAAAAVNSSATTLAAAISGVDTGGVSASVSASRRTAAEVSSNMSGLLSLVSALPSTPLQAALVADIDACTSDTAAYDLALGAAGTESGSYTGTSLSSFGAYLGSMDSDAASVQSAGTAYVTSYEDVQAALSALIAGGILLPHLPQLQAYAAALADLHASVASTTSGTNGSLRSETGAMAAVETDISSLGSVVSSNQGSISMSTTLTASISGVSGEVSSYLNSTASAAVGTAASDATATAASAESFVASADACLGSTIGTYAGTVATLASSGAALTAQTRGSASATAAAMLFVQSDSRTRVSEASAGQSDLSQALQLFSGQDVPTGVAALARASLEFQAASGASV